MADLDQLMDHDGDKETRHLVGMTRTARAELIAAHGSVTPHHQHVAGPPCPGGVTAANAQSVIESLTPPPRPVISRPIPNPSASSTTEASPLLMVSAKPHKITSPPPLPALEEEDAAAPSDGNNRKRMTAYGVPVVGAPADESIETHATEYGTTTAHDTDVASLALHSSNGRKTTSGSGSKASPPLPRHRLHGLVPTRLREMAGVLIIAVSMLTFGVMYQHHCQANEQAHALRTAMHARVHARNQFMPFRSYDENNNDNGMDNTDADLTRQHALSALSADLDLLQAPRVRRSVNGQLNTTLRVSATQFTNGPISFWTRAYEDSIPGPLLSLQPGDTLTITLVNDLGPNIEGTWTPNTYHQPNTTNLHVHGMHVDPTGIADNVFRAVEPGESMVTQIHIPTNHPRGLFHYHPHFHGSVFVQMSGGMVGALVVEDDANTMPQEYEAVTRHVMVLQEFRFDGGLAADLRKAAEAARSDLQMQAEYTDKTVLDARVRHLFTDVHLHSVAENITAATSLSVASFPEGAWPPSVSRFFVVNGQYMPKLQVQPEENVVLRLVNAGGSSTLELTVPGCSWQLIASDGIYLASPRLVEILFVSPGARVDVVMNCRADDAGLESLRPIRSVQDTGVNEFLGADSDVFRGVLGFVEVIGESKGMAPVTSAPPPPALYADNDLRELSGTDIAQMDDAEPFRFEFTMYGKEMRDGFLYKNYFINHALFSMPSIRDMPLDVVQEWVIVNAQDGKGKPTIKNHPFHLHTNAFQIIDMSHGDGVDYEIGDWRDVIAVPTPGNVTIRFRPVDFKGHIVAHCHILGHSDAGMVASVQIV